MSDAIELHHGKGEKPAPLTVNEDGTLSQATEVGLRELMTGTG